MSSILTNTSAMTALQNLKSINSSLAETQSMISTGLEVGSARDNSSVWSISKTMESDVQGFKAISDSLSLGESTIAVARNASETVTELLTDVKSKIVAAQEENVDTSKIQTDIESLTDQIKSVVGAAQFNGLNLVNGSQTDSNSNGNDGIDVLSSLDRNSTGGVIASSIGVDAQNLSTNAGDDITAGTNTGTASATTLAANGGADSVTFDSFAFLTAADPNATPPVPGTSTGTSALKSSTAGVDNTDTDGLVVGDAIEVKIGDIQGTYRVREDDTADSVATGIKDALQNAGLDTDDFSFDLSTAGALTITNETSEADIDVEFGVSRGTGLLSDLEEIDVTTDPEAALSVIEGMLSGVIDAAASFGTAEERLDTQASFISSLSDSLTTGIGSLVDADLEEVSAKLQALQVQQQLGVQSLSIANQAPQSILSLFG